MPEGLDALVTRWVGTREKTFEYTHPGHHTTWMIVEGSGRKPNQYDCLRFFTVGDKWFVSMDKTDIDLKDAVKWLQGELQ